MKKVPVLVIVVVAGMVVVVDVIEADDVTGLVVVVIDADDVIRMVFVFVAGDITGVGVVVCITGWLVMISIVEIAKCLDEKHCKESARKCLNQDIVNDMSIVTKRNV